MAVIGIRDVSGENVDDLCRICIPPGKRDDSTFITGMEQKGKWAREMLRRWGSFAKLAYAGTTPVGLVQYEPVCREKVVYIHCVYVPEREYWRRGIATQLLSSLMEEMRRPKAWFDGEPASALVTRTFPGEKPGQYPARLFFAGMGFRQVGEDPDHLYYPLREGFTYQPTEEEQARYIPQQEDRDKVVIMYGPSFCPFSYVFLRQAEGVIREIAPQIPVRWIDRSGEPEEVDRRGSVEGCIVNARQIESFVLDKEGFRKEVTEALQRA